MGDIDQMKFDLEKYQVDNMNLQEDKRHLQKRVDKIEDELVQKIEELKLLKDYVYGVDRKGKDVHMHKF